MKKSLLLIAALFAFSFANAQAFKFGLKAGWNYSSVTGGDNDFFGDPDYKNSYHFGIMPAFEFNGFLGLRPEILYTSKGFATNFTDPRINTLGGYNEIEQKTNFNYLSIPLLLDFKAGPVFFELGPEFAYMLAVTSEVKTDIKDVNGKVSDHKDEKHTEKSELGVQSVDLGYVAGIGINLPAGFGLGVRYNGGFLSVFDRVDASGHDINDVKNSVFMVSLNYTFGGHYEE